jgi:hypothetical protein
MGGGEDRRRGGREDKRLGGREETAIKTRSPAGPSGLAGLVVLVFDYDLRPMTYRLLLSSIGRPRASRASVAGSGTLMFRRFTWPAW